MMGAAHRPRLQPVHYVLIAVLDLVIALVLLTGRWSADLPVANPPPPVAPVATPHSRLRVRNVGSLPIRELVVFFPDESLRFGDIAAGAMSKYLDVPSGVYRYAALR